MLCGLVFYSYKKEISLLILLHNRCNMQSLARNLRQLQFELNFE